MDRRSWLWRRKSSEKSPGETDSSGSISSPSERFSDEQAYSNHGIQSPEVTSKATLSDIDLNDTVKTLKEKLSAALLNISAKEDLVKQHAKVAEEAVSGWEKAEREVLALKQQLEALAQKNSALGERVSHLDGALKECLRQLRQAKEEQEQKIHETVLQKTVVWEATKSEFEKQLVELQLQLHAANTEAVSSVNPDLHTKLEAAEKENSALRLELLCRAKELELTTIERELSTQAAEAASKQHLDSIKKVAKLEAECRRLKAVTSKALPVNDQRSVMASVYVESFTDSQSDSGDRLSMIETDIRKISGFEANEHMHNHSDYWASALITQREQFKNEKDVGKDLRVPSVEINLMDDFLEMERLAALPGTENRNFPDSRTLSDQPPEGKIPLKAELEAMINCTMELEEKLEKMELEKMEMEMALSECQDQLKESKGSLDAAEVKLVELQTQLTSANEARRLTEAEHIAANEKLKTSRYELKVKLVELQMQLAKEKETKRAVEMECESVNLKLKTSRNHLDEVEVKLVELHAQLTISNEARYAAEMELETTNVNKEAAESRLSILESDLKTLLSRVSSLEEELQKEQAFSGEAVSNCQNLEHTILRMKSENERQKAATLTGEMKIMQDKELAVAATKFAECQKTIASLGRQLKTLATLEDFLLDSEKELEIPVDGPQNGAGSWKLHSAHWSLLKEDSETNTRVDDTSKDRGEGEVLHPRRNEIITSEKCTNGFGKLYPHSNSGSQIENQQ